MWCKQLLMCCCFALLSASQSHSVTELSGTIGPFTTTINKIHKVTTVKRSLPTDSPMLNFIFDSHNTLSKHIHHKYNRNGPHFEVESKNITAQAGATVILDCKIYLLSGKTVSWLRRHEDGEKMTLLTYGNQTYTGDLRYTVEFQYPDNWRLKIRNVNSSDEGQYECQISTHPPMTIVFNLHINAPSVVIIDEMGENLADKYYEAGSTIQLLCVVRHLAMQIKYNVLQWIKNGNSTLNYDTVRGGISVKTDLMDIGANSTLSIAKAGPSDSGNYTCALTIMPDQPATVHVHVLNGESLAELHHGAAFNIRMNKDVYLIIIILINLLFNVTR